MIRVVPDWKLWEQARVVVTDATTFPILCTVLVGLAAVNRARLRLHAALLLLLLSTVFLIFELWVFYVPAHLYASVWMFCAVILTWYSSGAKLSRKFMSVRSKTIVSLLLIVVSVSYCVYYRTNGDSARETGRKLKETIRHMDPKPDDLYVAWTTSLPYECVSPFENLGEIFKKMRLVGVNWLARSPINLQRLREFQVENLLRQLDDKHIFLISTDAVNQYHIAPYIDYSFDRQSHFEKIADSACTVYRVRFSDIPRPKNNLTLEERWKSELDTSSKSSR